MTSTVLATSFEVGDPAVPEFEAHAWGISYLTAGSTADGFGAAPTPLHGSRVFRAARKVGDGQVQSGDRAELQCDYHADGSLIEWYGIATWLNTDWLVNGDTTQWRIFPQWHLGSGSPGIKRIYDNGRIYWRRRSTGSNDVLIADMGVPVTGQWVRNVLKVKWSVGNDGFIEIYDHNHQLIAPRFDGRTVATASVSVYQKLGIYTTGGSAGYLFYDDYRHLNTDDPDLDLFDLVLPGGVVAENPSLAHRRACRLLMGVG